MIRPVFGFLAFMTFVSMAPGVFTVPAHAAGKEKKEAPKVKYCNELPYKQCVPCAVARGYSPSQYEAYCSTRR